MKKTSRRTFAKSVVTALATAPVVSMIGCNRGGQTDGSPTPSPSPGATVEPKKPRDDTPITVGGGGGNRPPKRKLPLTETYTKTVFDHDHFKNPSGSDDKWYQNSAESARYVLFDDGLGIQENLTRYLGDGDITIKFSHSHDITITQHPFGVKFKFSENLPSGTQEHRNTADKKPNRIVFENGKKWPKDHDFDDNNIGDGWFVCISKDFQGGNCSEYVA
jgi:hypothetical protein